MKDQNSGVTAEEIKDQESKIKIASSPLCGDDVLKFAFCTLHFDLP